MIVAIIPARAGSKRLPGKNKKYFLGKPLISWTIELASKVWLFDKIFVSTNDKDIFHISDYEYQNISNLQTIWRNEDISTDDTPTWKVIEDLYKQNFIFDETIVVLLQLTSVLRTKEDIENAILIFLHDNSKGVVSIYKKDAVTYKRNGAIYIDYYHKWIKNKNVDGQYYLMPKERSVDIDTLEDFEKAEQIMKKRLENKNE